MEFGLNNDCGKDITLYKKDYSSGKCEQECYDYSGETYALTGKRHFNINRIVVYQLKETEEMKLERENKISELTGIKIETILFDSTLHKWNINDSEFGSRIKGHRHVCIVIEDNKNNIFGGYCSKEIGINKYHFDSKSFVFSMKRNGKWKMKKYPLKEGSYDLQIYLDNNDLLFAFGAEDKDNPNYLKDIVIYKKDSTKKSNCEQYSYDYEGEENVLCDNNPKRFEV